MTNFDFNDAGKQKSFDLIPDNTVAPVQLTIRLGGAGDGGWLRRASGKKGASEGVDCEFIVVNGPYAKRKIFQLYTVHGVTPGHAEAGEISRKAFCAMLESAYGIRPDDKSDAAQKVRLVSGWQDFDQLRFVVRIGVRPPLDGYAAKNTIKEIITPDMPEWKKLEQIDRSTLSNKPATSTATPTQPTPQPASAITRPQWAQPEKKEEK